MISTTSTMRSRSCSIQLGPGKDCAIDDFGINSGVSRAVTFSQRIVGTVPDGIMGPVTLAAINAYDPANFINQLCTARLEFLRGLGTSGSLRGRLVCARGGLADVQPEPGVGQRLRRGSRGPLKSCEPYIPAGFWKGMGSKKQTPVRRGMAGHGRVG